MHDDAPGRTLARLTAFGGSVFGIGMSEMLVILGVALLVFGPTELPQIAKKFAKGMREVRRASDDLRRSIDLDDDDDQRFRRPPPPPEPPPSITGSVLTAESDEAVPAIVPAAAVAVGSKDVDDEAAGAGGDAVPAASDGSPPTEPSRG